MKKLRLDLGELRIHSFETAAATGDPKPPCGTRAPECWCTVVDPGLTGPVY